MPWLEQSSGPLLSLAGSCFVRVGSNPTRPLRFSLFAHFFVTVWQVRARVKLRSDRNSLGRTSLDFGAEVCPREHVSRGEVCPDEVCPLGKFRSANYD